MIVWIIRMGTLYYKGNGAWSRDKARAYRYNSYETAYAISLNTGGVVELA